MKANITAICSNDAQEEIRQFLNRFFKSIAIKDTEKNQVILAIDEAVANTIIHGNQKDSSKKFDLDIEVNSKRILIELCDVGEFDKEQRNQKINKNLQDIVSNKQKGGLGLKLIYSIMDIVNFYSVNDSNYLMLVKLLHQKEEINKSE